MNTTRLVDITGIITSGSRGWASYYSDDGALFLRMTNLPKNGIKLFQRGKNMSDREQVIKHLEIIQGVVNRLANNSSLIKGWSMTMLAAATVFISNNQQQSQYILLCFLIPVLGFWILDSYYLWQERIFREIYNDVRKKEKTDFKMNVNDQKSKPKCKWYNAFFSVTLITFYIIEAVFIVSAFLIFEGGIL